MHQSSIATACIVSLIINLSAQPAYSIGYKGAENIGVNRT